jgi:aryl-alcohol dehydrogenase-like predicted oxidoreductase
VELGQDYGIPALGHFGRPSEKEAIALVAAAVEAGINLIDTARGYGQSETILGQALKPYRRQVVIATKASLPRLEAGETPPPLREFMLAQLDDSLRALQTDYVDLWQIHNLDAHLLSRPDDLAELLTLARRSGKVRWVGASVYGRETLVDCLATDLFDTLQVTYSILDQRLANRVLPLADQKKIGILARSVLLKGVLTDRADFLPVSLDVLRQRSAMFRHLIPQFGLNFSPAQVAIAFALAQPYLSSILIGVRTQAELLENLQVLQVNLPEALLAQLYPLALDDDDLLNPGTWGIP